MRRTWDEPVLYHAVSSYQLLEVMLHRLLVHPGRRAALVLPDFIQEKYPQWKALESQGFFHWVRLFPYLTIPHRGKDQVAADALAAYDALSLPPLEDFAALYIAGAHFYFSLCPLERGLPFSLLEDAAGTLCSPQLQAAILARKFPRHAALAQELGLFSGENPLVREQICCVKAQENPAALSEKARDFSVEKALQDISPWQRRKVVRFFLPGKIRTQADTILLTQQFSGLGLLTEAQQLSLYRQLGEGLFRERSLLVKKHPDDRLSYEEVFPGAQVVERPFPAELLPYVFAGRRPQRVAAFGSSSLANLGEHFQTMGLPLPAVKQEGPLPP